MFKKEAFHILFLGFMLIISFAHGLNTKEKEKDYGTKNMDVPNSIFGTYPYGAITDRKLIGDKTIDINSDTSSGAYLINKSTRSKSLRGNERPSVFELTKKLGAKIETMQAGRCMSRSVINTIIPTTFDSRSAWENCISPILQQGACGSCWAFAVAQTLSDRMCIAARNVNRTVVRLLSPQQLVSCDEGCTTGGVCNDACNGGTISAPWDYTSSIGLVGATCVPYTASTEDVEKCPQRDSDPNTIYCTNPICSKRKIIGRTTISAKNIRPSAQPNAYRSAHRGSNPSAYSDAYGMYSLDAIDDVGGDTRLTDVLATEIACNNTAFKSSGCIHYPTVKSIQTEIMTRGTVAASFTIYTDFMLYESGVYVADKNSGQHGGHAVRIIGWGKTKNDVSYWIIANQWGEDWGMGGYGYVRMGTNEAGFENSVIAGDAILPLFDYYETYNQASPSAFFSGFSALIAFYFFVVYYLD